MIKEKKKILFKAIFAVTAFILAVGFVIYLAIDKESESKDKKYYNIKYYNAAILTREENVKEGSLIKYFEPDEKVSKVLKFDYWKTSDGSKIKPLTIKRVHQDMKLDAYYSIDKKKYIKKVDDLSTGIFLISSKIKTEKKIFSKNITITKDVYGSAFAYKKTDNYYYLLTCAHLFVPDETANKGMLDYDSFDIKVKDYLNNDYDADVICYDKYHDLAVLRIKNKNEYHVSRIERYTYGITNDCVSISKTSSNKNYVTFGEKKESVYIKSNNNKIINNIDFPVTYHNASIYKGSAGSPLFNFNSEIMGINVATGRRGDQTYAISSSIIIAFLVMHHCYY